MCFNSFRIHAKFPVAVFAVSLNKTCHCTDIDALAVFEYKTISIDSKETEHSEKALSDKLNHYGKEGWELVAIARPLFKAMQGFFDIKTVKLRIWNGCVYPSIILVFLNETLKKSYFRDMINTKNLIGGTIWQFAMINCFI